MLNNIKDLLIFSQNLNVLFVEDNYDVKVQLFKLFNNFFPNIDDATDGQIALEKYNKFNEENDKFYDLVITDISMPKLNGIELSKRLIEKNPNQLILVISAHTESDKLLELLNIGIYKFIQKPIEYEILVNTLSSVISKIKREKTYLELENKYKEIKNDNIILNKLAITDNLTSIYNRRYIDNKLFECFQNIDSYSLQHLSIIFLDIDNFKSINDTYGHIIGDKVLITIANLLKSNIENKNIVGRWGGEEFIIICENQDIKTSCILANKIKDIIANHHFDKVETVTASFGVASYEKGENITSLIQKADYNLYQAKEEGKNRVYC
ncbi:diguanylate cyclase [Halarcobacter sp.]|uniref:diguanylate cyclase response regulator n=1 Tax=Halarcobacter sp. TaxID=2321133 RepID=UPI002AAB7C06|nr:diguanylate cyclase [Halarcobacter sp.]